MAAALALLALVLFGSQARASANAFTDVGLEAGDCAGGQVDMMSATPADATVPGTCASAMPTPPRFEDGSIYDYRPGFARPPPESVASALDKSALNSIPDPAAHGGQVWRVLARPAGYRWAPQTKPSLVYRGGSGTADNMTPRPGIDHTGLSTFDSPAAAAPKGGKVQVIDTSKLKCVVACPDAPPPGHVSLQSADLSEIPGWAATRGTGQVHTYTQDIMDAIVGEIRVPKP